MKVLGKKHPNGCNSWVSRLIAGSSRQHRLNIFATGNTPMSGSSLAPDAHAEAYYLFWQRRARWLFLCGVMPWNWFSRDIWTAWIMAEREMSAWRGKFRG